MKRFISLLLTFCMVLSLFAGMGSVFAANSTKTLLNLDFENETDLSKFQKSTYFGDYSASQSIAQQVNHAMKLTPAPNAFRVAYAMDAQYQNYELSFKLKNAGAATDAVSVWIHNTGSENGYRMFLRGDRITIHCGGQSVEANSIAMPENYRDLWHTYAIKCIGTTMTVSMDGVQLSETEMNHTALTENGICFSAFNDSVLIDDLKLTALNASGEESDSLLNLDFENTDDLNHFTQDSFSGMAADQRKELATDTAMKLTPAPSAFHVYHSLTEAVSNLSLSFKLKNAGAATDSFSVWLFNEGTEQGCRAILYNDKIGIRLGGANDDAVQYPMTAGYRDEWHKYTFKCVDNNLTLLVDGRSVLTTTMPDTQAKQNGICFSAWNDSFLIDDLLLEQLPEASEADDLLLTLDFEQESDVAKLKRDGWQGLSASETVERIEDADVSDNHVLRLVPGPYAFRVSYSPEEKAEDIELSFRMKNSGSQTDSISVWVHNAGSESGYRVIMAGEKLTMCHYLPGTSTSEYQVTDDSCDMESGYRNQWHTYTFRSLENILTFSVDGVEKLRTEDAYDRPENGFCFSAWNDSILLDDIALKKVYVTENRVAEPTVSPESGAYLNSVNVEIGCSTDGATLYYTTDGTYPTAESTVYTAPITIRENCTLRVVGIKEGFYRSKIVERTYDITDMQLTKEDIRLSVGDVSAISDVYSSSKAQAELTATFTSSNDQVATVDENGFIKAVAPGTATITATTNVSGASASATCTVTVNNPCEKFFYVAPDGSDNNDGSIDQPWATLAHARDVLRTLELPDGGITVYFRDGEYFFEDSVLFTPEDSGEAGKPIVYASYPGENARFHSGRNLKGWKLLQAEDYPAGLPEAAYGNVYVLDIEPGWRFHDLYASGQRQQVARQVNSDKYQDWPGFDKDNPPTLPTVQSDASEKGMLLTFKDGELDNLPSNGDVEVNLLTAVWWNNLPVVKDIDTGNNTARLHSYMPTILVEWSYCFQENNGVLGRYNLMNAPKFLDEAGEWCVDSAAGKVYWWPQNTSDLENAVAPEADELIRLEGDGENKNWANQVEYIEFRDLEFSYVDRKGEDELVSENELEPIVMRNSENPYSAVFMRGTANCAIINCTMRHLGTYAVSMHNYTQNNRVINCTMEDLGSGGVEIYGYGPGFVDNNGRNTVLNNVIRNTGKAPYMHSSAVTLFGTSYNDIRLNLIEKVPYSAIYMAGSNPSLMNPNHFGRKGVAACDTYGNQGAMNRVRENEMAQVEGSDSFESIDANPVEGAIPYQHLNYNICSYNIALDYMMLMADGGCYYSWHTGYGNEYSYNVACIPEGVLYAPLLYLDGGTAYSVMKENIGCIAVDNCRIWVNCYKGNEIRNNQYFYRGDNNAASQAYAALTDAIKKMQTNLFGSSSATDDVTPIITIAPTAVDNLILSIGEVTINSGDAIQAARDAYNALTEAQKALVKHLNTLTAAEAKYAELKGESDADAAAAKAVTGLIDAIGTVTLDSKAKIDAARAAYDALTNAQKEFISAETLKKLTDAEAAYTKLKNEADADAAAAKAVTDLIDAIGDVTLDSKAKIDAARAAYDALTDAQKALISAETLKKLTDAEARYAALVASIIPTVPVKPTKPSHNEKPEQSTMRFTDVAENTWYYDGIEFAYDNGIMNGVGNGKFEPHADTTRGMIVTMLARMEGVDTSSGKVWYEAGQKWAMENGISDGTNMAGRITREQLATILYRYAKLKGYDVSKTTPLDGFSDAGTVSSYAVDAMRWAVAADLVKGAGGRLDPQGTATRAQVATILMRFSQKIEK